jgi:hypothetical protein
VILLRRGLLTGAVLLAVAALPAAGTAGAAGATAPLAGRWTFHTAPQASGFATELSAVACPTAAFCMAVGIAARQGGSSLVAERRVGGHWTAYPPKQPAGSSPVFDSIACPGSQTCLAVGNFIDPAGAQVPFVETYRQGVGWALTRLPIPRVSLASVNGVSCSGPADCVAAGWFLSTSTDQAWAALWNGSRWREIAPPTYAPGAVIASLACRADFGCLALGQRAAGSSFTNVEYRWTGTAWRIQEIPQPSGASGTVALTAIACPSNTYCVAVGELYSLTAAPISESWDGSRWTAHTIPSRVSGTEREYMNAVHCWTASFCMAVGLTRRLVGTHVFETATAAEWTGGKWRSEDLVLPVGQSYLAGVRCVSLKTCMAVGGRLTPTFTSSTPLVETMNGSTGTASIPASARFFYSTLVFAISCVTPGSCVSVGYAEGTFGPSNWAAIWSGNAERHVWTADSPPNPIYSTSRLYDVSCASAKACMAVGQAVGLSTGANAELWDGSKWSSARAGLGPASLTALETVSCPASNLCVAVGAHLSGISSASPVSALWNGHSWRLASMPMPAGTAVAIASSVSCATTTYCVAVGNADTSAGVEAPWEVVWNGKSWTETTPITPAHTSDLQLTHVACPSATSCTAVGSFNRGTVYYPIIEAFNGRTWSTEVLAGQPLVGAILNDVSCPSVHACVLTGYTPSKAIMQTWNGSTWRAAAAPLPNGAAVSCVAVGSCMVIGDTGPALDYRPVAASEGSLSI